MAYTKLISKDKVVYKSNGKVVKTVIHDQADQNNTPEEQQKQQQIDVPKTNKRLKKKVYKEQNNTVESKKKEQLVKKTQGTDKVQNYVDELMRKGQAKPGAVGCPEKRQKGTQNVKRNKRKTEEEKDEEYRKAQESGRLGY